MKQKDTKIVATEQGELFACDECGTIPQDQVFIPVQWALGSVGSVGLCCADKFEDEATISEDGMSIAHWPKSS